MNRYFGRREIIFKERCSMTPNTRSVICLEPEKLCDYKMRLEKERINLCMKPEYLELVR